MNFILGVVRITLPAIKPKGLKLQSTSRVFHTNLQFSPSHSNVALEMFVNFPEFWDEFHDEMFSVFREEGMNLFRIIIHDTAERKMSLFQD